MTALVRTELLKLRTARGIRLLLAAVALIGLLGVARLVQASGSAGGVRAGDPEAWPQVLGTGMSGGLLVLLVGALAVTTELRHGTLTGTLLVTPDRTRVMVAKMLASALVGAVVALLTALAAAAVGLASGLLAGPPPWDVLAMVAGAVTLTAFWGWIGAAVGLLVRHQVAALVAPLIWLLVVETLVESMGAGPVRWWLPGGAGAGLSGADLPGVLPAWLAALVLTGYAVLLTVPALRRLAAADIT